MEEYDSYWLGDFFDDAEGPFVFVDLDYYNGGDAWFCDGNSWEKISLKKYKTHRDANGQQRTQDEIPVIWDVDIGYCIIRKEFFIIPNHPNRKIGEPTPMYSPKCREKEPGKMRYLQRKLRNDCLKAKIDPNVFWEFVEDEENRVTVVDKQKHRTVYTESEFIESEYYKNSKMWGDGGDEDDQSGVPDT
ncbi:hypothetical protein [Methanogenium organophilum]|uniref:Uncharacterized protein n=1 Tax=Methanogenium organophilum TaxID=2199 RepID=A0A9X9S307_METOG|nr:hypothetical protein [Methanogenium organophilum]WAI00959.1 hypothetical protein OU421_11140 [Methanogenium organophilum]